MTRQDDDFESIMDRVRLSLQDPAAAMPPADGAIGPDDAALPVPAEAGAPDPATAALPADEPTLPDDPSGIDFSADLPEVDPAPQPLLAPVPDVDEEDLDPALMAILHEANQRHPVPPPIVLPDLPGADIRRRVFLVPGHPPLAPASHRELYREQARIQAAVSGHDIAIPTLEGETRTRGWRVSARVDGAAVETGIELLDWSDLGRSAAPADLAAGYGLMLRTAWIYLATGTLRRLAWLGRGPILAAGYPVAMLVLQLLLALGAGLIAGGLLAWPVSRLAGLIGWGTEVLPRLVFWTAALPVALLALRWGRAQDGRLRAWSLLADQGYLAQTYGAYPLPLEARMETFGKVIAEALAEDIDEVLVVGHGAGATLGVSILADLIRAGAVDPDGAELSFLTLGQTIPMVSFLPEATRLRADLAYLSARDELTWIDVSAEDDPLAFSLCDPVAVSGVQPDLARWPKVISADFARTLQPGTLDALGRRPVRLHGQYLCAFDRISGQPGDYDWFRITAGPLSLAERFAHRPPSRSRIDVTASRFTSRAA